VIRARSCGSTLWSELVGDRGRSLRTAVGLGGAAIVWSRWSERAGYHNSFEAFFHPTGLAFHKAFLLATHAPFMLVGAAVLFFHFARQGWP